MRLRHSGILQGHRPGRDRLSRAYGRRLLPVVRAGHPVDGARDHLRSVRPALRIRAGIQERARPQPVRRHHDGRFDGSGRDRRGRHPRPAKNGPRPDALDRGRRRVDPRRVLLGSDAARPGSGGGDDPIDLPLGASSPRRFRRSSSCPCPRAIPKSTRTRLPVYFASVHRKPVVNGYSGYAPPGYRIVREAMDAFPSPATLRAPGRYRRDARPGRYERPSGRRRDGRSSAASERTFPAAEPPGRGGRPVPLSPPAGGRAAAGPRLPAPRSATGRNGRPRRTRIRSGPAGPSTETRRRAGRRATPRRRPISSSSTAARSSRFRRSSSFSTPIRSIIRGISLSKRLPTGPPGRRSLRSPASSRPSTGA